MALTLCSVNDIPEGQARSYTLAEVNVLALKSKDKIYVYLNRCPHFGIPLHWEEHDLLDKEGLLLRCSTHGALFIKESGECIQGPCQGENLWQIDYSIENAKVLIDEAELPAKAPQQ